ncbi:sensory rhodopsin transducer [Longitalea luteola]|uniref:sensory rhodopsin transducer n=1 Tax=Longitalea luteola TaxID=2812563 RepID=UPI001A96D886|nr:sensory rhodopsin transducer [Longitalea luteola]
MKPLGKRIWAIPDGYIPSKSNGPAPQMTSHESACILNVGDQPANVEITIYFSDKAPVGPYKITVPAERTRHIRFNDLKDPQPIPFDTEYASLLVSDIPVIVQHTRLDSRQAENALLSTIAYPASE